MRYSSAEASLKFIEQRKLASPKELSEHLDITQRAVFKQLAKLLKEQKVSKIGLPPKVFYRLADSAKPNYSSIRLKPEHQKVITDNYLYISALGEYLEGVSGFIRFCQDRELDVNWAAKQYFNIINNIAKQKKTGLINASSKINSSFTKNNLTATFYLDFYSIPQFGKTKLGQLLLYAKQSQDRARIQSIADIAKPYIQKLIKNHKIDAIGFIPPTIKREVQFMKELQKHLNLKVPIIKITKLKTEIIVPQKTLSKLVDRVINAQNTLVVEDNRVFKNILLIDDAVGSGATLNETAAKLIERGQAKKVYGLAITGSLKGFDVISEV